MPRRATYKCPQCDSTEFIPIMYGYPGPTMVELSHDKKVKLGGCAIILGEDGKECMPNRYCSNCEHEWHTSENYTKPI
jgi:hypothetical protein